MPLDVRIVLVQSRCSITWLDEKKTKGSKRGSKGEQESLGSQKRQDDNVAAHLCFSSTASGRSVSTHLSNGYLLRVKQGASRSWPLIKESDRQHIRLSQAWSLGTEIFLPLPPSPDISQSGPTCPGGGRYSSSCRCWHSRQPKAWREEPRPAQPQAPVPG